MDTRMTESVPRGRPADAIDREWAAALVGRIGMIRASKHVGCSRSSLANVVGGLNCYPGTHALVREARLRAQLQTAA